MLFGASAITHLITTEPTEVDNEADLLVAMQAKLGPWADPARLLHHIRATRGKLHWAVNSFLREVMSQTPPPGALQPFIETTTAATPCPCPSPSFGKGATPAFQSDACPPLIPPLSSVASPAVPCGVSPPCTFSLDSLPTGVLEDIVQQLDLSSVLAIGTTCKRLLQATQPDRVWQSLFTARWGKVHFPIHAAMPRRPVSKPPSLPRAAATPPQDSTMPVDLQLPNPPGTYLQGTMSAPDSQTPSQAATGSASHSGSASAVMPPSPTRVHQGSSSLQPPRPPSFSLPRAGGQQADLQCNGSASPEAPPPLTSPPLSHPSLPGTHLQAGGASPGEQLIPPPPHSMPSVDPWQASLQGTAMHSLHLSDVRASNDAPSGVPGCPSPCATLPTASSPTAPPPTASAGVVQGRGLTGATGATCSAPIPTLPGSMPGIRVAAMSASNPTGLSALGPGLQGIHSVHMLVHPGGGAGRSALPPANNSPEAVEGVEAGLRTCAADAMGACVEVGAWQLMYKTQASYARAWRCPCCGEPGAVVPLVFGFPSKELLAGMRIKRLILGGDHLVEVASQCWVWACTACNKSFRYWPYEAAGLQEEWDQWLNSTPSCQTHHNPRPYTYEL